MTNLAEPLSIEVGTERPPAGPRTAMVLTTQASTAHSLKNYLSRERFRVHLFSRCDEAIRALSSNVHEIALVDEVLEDATGIHFIQQARGQGFQTPIVLISDDYNDARSQLQNEAGICRPITTPVTKFSLRHCLRLVADAQPHSPGHHQL